MAHLSFNLGNASTILDLELKDSEMPENSHEITEVLLSLLEEDFELDEYLGGDHLAVSTISALSDTQDMERDLEEGKLSPPQIKCATTSPVIAGRFKKLNEEQLKTIEENRQAKSTKRATAWGMKIFEDWCTERFGTVPDMETIPVDILNKNLRMFYAEAAPKHITQRTKFMPEQQASVYHTNSFKSIHSAISRHLKDLGRAVDIVRDREFRSSNNMLDGQLKLNVKEGVSRPTKHKDIINDGDLHKIATYLHPVADKLDPVVLRLRVLYDLAFHFVSRELDFHKQLSRDSFAFQVDQNEQEYVTISYELRQKTRQGGLDSDEGPSEKRMYATGNERCPVNSLRVLLNKSDPGSQSLFSHCDKNALKDPTFTDIWYTCTPVKQYQFSRYARYRQKCSVQKSYTAHCLRATSIHKLSTAGFELRHIMYMSGQANEGSIRSYSRECSARQKQNISHTLATVSSDSHPIVSRNVNTPSSMSFVENDKALITPPHGHVATPSQSSFSSNVMSSGFISNSSFNNCTFQFTK